MKPATIWPRGLSREKAASYVGVSASTFDKLVKQKLMPEPKQISRGRSVWDIQQLDFYFESLPQAAEAEYHAKPWEA